MTILVFAVVFALGIVVLFETDTMTAGLYTGETQSEFFWTAFMELLTLGCVSWACACLSLIRCTPNW